MAAAVLEHALILLALYASWLAAAPQQPAAWDGLAVLGLAGPGAGAQPGLATDLASSHCGHDAVASGSSPEVALTASSYGCRATDWPSFEACQPPRLFSVLVACLVGTMPRSLWADPWPLTALRAAAAGRSLPSGPGDQLAVAWWLVPAVVAAGLLALVPDVLAAAWAASVYRRQSQGAAEPSGLGAVPAAAAAAAAPLPSMTTSWRGDPAGSTTSGQAQRRGTAGGDARSATPAGGPMAPEPAGPLAPNAGMLEAAGASNGAGHARLPAVHQRWSTSSTGAAGMAPAADAADKGSGPAAVANASATLQPAEAAQVSGPPRLAELHQRVGGPSPVGSAGSAHATAEDEEPLTPLPLRQSTARTASDAVTLWLSSSIADASTGGTSSTSDAGLLGNMMFSGAAPTAALSLSRAGSGMGGGGGAGACSHGSFGLMPRRGSAQDPVSAAACQISDIHSHGAGVAGRQFRGREGSLAQDTERPLLRSPSAAADDHLSDSGAPAEVHSQQLADVASGLLRRPRDAFPGFNTGGSMGRLSCDEDDGEAEGAEGSYGEEEDAAEGEGDGESSCSTGSRCLGRSRCRVVLGQDRDLAQRGAAQSEARPADEAAHPNGEAGRVRVR